MPREQSTSVYRVQGVAWQSLVSHLTAAHEPIRISALEQFRNSSSAIHGNVIYLSAVKEDCDGEALFVGFAVAGDVGGGCG